MGILNRRKTDSKQSSRICGLGETETEIQLREFLGIGYVGDGSYTLFRQREDAFVELLSRAYRVYCAPIRHLGEMETEIQGWLYGELPRSPINTEREARRLARNVMYDFHNS